MLFRSRSLLPLAECPYSGHCRLPPPSQRCPHPPITSPGKLPLGSPIQCPFWTHLCPGRLSWQSLTHQQSLLARFPSLGLGLGALAPDEGGIACGNRRRRSEGEGLGSQGLQDHSNTGAISKVTTKLQPAHYQVWLPLKRYAAAVGWGAVENPGEAGQREKAPRQREEEQARRVGPGRRGVWPPNPGQAHITPQGFPPTHPEGSHHWLCLFP